MTRTSTNILQLVLPFGGVQDRVRAAAETGRFSFMAEAYVAMERFDISDVLILRSMSNCTLAGHPRPGSQPGEWQCAIFFTGRGFRAGGVIDLILSDRRVFVINVRWDRTHV